MATKPYTLLLVDDSEEILMALEAAFLDSPYEVIVTTNPLKAYSIIENQHVDLVVSDIEMPNMTGIELLRKIKAYNGMIRVIIITGYITVNNTLNVFRYGAEDLFFKPVNLREVRGAVDAAARRLDRVHQLLAETAAHSRRSADGQ